MMDQGIKDLLEIQTKLVEQARLDTEAKLQVIKSTEDLIRKQDEFLTINKSIYDSITEIKGSIATILSSVKPIESVDIQLKQITVVLQMFVAIIANVNNVSKEAAEKLQDHILRLSELSVLSGKQTNNFENFIASNSKVKFEDDK